MNNLFSLQWYEHLMIRSLSVNIETITLPFSMCSINWTIANWRESFCLDAVFMFCKQFHSFICSLFNWNAHKLQARMYIYTNKSIDDFWIIKTVWHRNISSSSSGGGARFSLWHIQHYTQIDWLLQLPLYFQSHSFSHLNFIQLMTRTDDKIKYIFLKST